CDNLGTSTFGTRLNSLPRSRCAERVIRWNREGDEDAAALRRWRGLVGRGDHDRGLRCGTGGALAERWRSRTRCDLRGCGHRRRAGDPTAGRRGGPGPMYGGNDAGVVGFRQRYHSRFTAGCRGPRPDHARCLVGPGRGTVEWIPAILRRFREPGWPVARSFRGQRPARGDIEFAARLRRTGRRRGGNVFALIERLRLLRFRGAAAQSSRRCVLATAGALRPSVY